MSFDCVLKQHSNVHLQAPDEQTDFISKLPNEILLQIFARLPRIRDVVQLNLVCKRWYNVTCSDQVWGKFVPNYLGMNLPKAKTKKDIIRKLWEQSYEIGEERWFANPLPGFVLHEAMIRNVERQTHGEWIESLCVLYIRLNALYPFTSDGRNKENQVLMQGVQEIFDKFGTNSATVPEPCGWTEMKDARSVLEKAYIVDKKGGMDFVLSSLESEWYLSEKISPPQRAHKLDQDGRIVQGRHLFDAGMEFDDSDKIIYVEGPERLSMKLFEQIHDVLINKNEKFIIYQLNDGCWNENFRYARHMVISDTAVVYRVDFFDL